MSDESLVVPYDPAWPELFETERARLELLPDLSRLAPAELRRREE